MANERQSGQQGEQQRSGSQSTHPTGSEAAERTSGRGGRQEGGTSVQRSQQGEYQRRGSWLPTSYSGFESPFAMMRRLSDEMDRLFEGFGFGRGLFPSAGRGGQQAGGQLGTWSPRVDLFERDNKLVVAAELPGIDRDNVQVEVDQDGITIQGERRQESTTNERGIYRSERSYGQFYRQIPLPEGFDADSAQATFRDGVLEIELDMPKQQPRGRKLEIREASATRGTSGSTAGGSTSSAPGATAQSSGSASSTH